MGITDATARSMLAGGLLVALAAGVAGCGGGGGTTAAEGRPGATGGGEASRTRSGTIVSESDRQRWNAAMELFRSAAVGGFTEAQCSQVIARFEEVNAQHQGGPFVEALYMIGVTHDRCGRPERAAEYYQRTLQHNERFCGARVAQGIAHYRAGRIAQARAEFERAVRDDARCTEGYVNLAILQRRDPATYGEALNNLRRALAINSSYLPAFNQMALLYLENAMRRADATGGSGIAGGTAQLSGQQQEPQSGEEGTAAARRAAARRAAAGQMLDLAEVVCRQAQLIDANYAPIYNTWGLINVQQGNIVAALAKFERAFHLDPNFFEAYMNFGELTLSFRGYEDAERAFRRATELRGDSYDAWLGLGAALRGLNRTDQAQAAYERAIQIDSNRPEAYYNLGLLYADYMGGTEPELRRAQEYFRQFAQRARGRPELAAVLQGVERTCGCEHEQQRQSGSRGRSAARVRAAARGYGRQRRACQSGRIEQIDCNIALQRELQRIQREAEEMQRQIEAQAAQQQGQAGSSQPSR
jgi:tetratricopeptide (TPR) repeat protein